MTALLQLSLKDRGCCWHGVHGSSVCVCGVCAHAHLQHLFYGFPAGLSGKEPTCNAGDFQKTRAQSLGWEEPLAEEMATHSSILTWRIPGQRSLADYSPWGRKESDTTERLKNSTYFK